MKQTTNKQKTKDPDQGDRLTWISKEIDRVVVVVPIWLRKPVLETHVCR